MAPTDGRDLLPGSPSLVAAIALAPNRPLSAHHPLGASSGFFEKSRGDWEELLEQTLAVSSFAAEFAALSEPEFGGLIEFLLQRRRLPFVYLSVHAPVKQLRASEDALIDQLMALPPHVESIVTHPDTLSDFALYRRLGRRLVLENMDDRKQTGRTADELDPVFTALPEAGFCLDIAHAWSLDPTMQLAHELLDRFGDRLREVHLSSLDGSRHVAVLAEHEPLFGPVLERCTDVPWILEAEMPERWEHPFSPVDRLVTKDASADR